MFLTETRLTNVARLRVVVVTLAVANGGCATDAAGTARDYSTVAGADVRENDCVGVPARERNLGILAYRDAIAGARSLKESTRVGKTEVSHDRGVAIAVRAQPGMSAPWLARVASCHITLASSRSGPPGEGDANDPLLVPGATVRVEESGTTYIVSIRVPDEQAALEVARRAQTLLMIPAAEPAAEVAR